MKPIIYLFCIILILGSCKNTTSENTSSEVAYYCPMHCEGDKTYDKEGSCPVCKMDLVKVESMAETTVNNSISDMSIYNLPSTWTTQDGKDIQLKDLQGDVLVMVMIYTSCKG